MRPLSNEYTPLVAKLRADYEAAQGSGLDLLKARIQVLDRIHKSATEVVAFDPRVTAQQFLQACGISNLEVLK